MSKTSRITRMQNLRLVSALNEAMSKRQNLGLERIGGIRPSRLAKLTAEADECDAVFERLLAVRGLAVGDEVRIVVDGPYKDEEAKVIAVQLDGRVVVRLDDAEVCPLATEVELIEPRRSSAVGPRRATA